MKLRIKDASIRLRLTQPEVDAFAERGIVEGTTPIGAGPAFTYALIRSTDIGSLSVRFDGKRIEVLVPEELAQLWTQTDRVGMESEQETAGEPLVILVEKDFQCLHRDDAKRDPDAYPHPAEANVASS